MERARVSYSAMINYLRKQGLTSWEAKQSVKGLRKIDRDLQRAFIRCFNEGVEPGIRIAGITYHELIVFMGMNVIQAFLFLDWLQKEPELALDTLDRTTPMEIGSAFLSRISDKVLDEIGDGGEKTEEDRSDLEGTGEDEGNAAFPDVDGADLGEPDPKRE